MAGVVVPAATQSWCRLKVRTWRLLSQLLASPQGVVMSYPRLRDGSDAGRQEDDLASSSHRDQAEGLVRTLRHRFLDLAEPDGVELEAEDPRLEP